MLGSLPRCCCCCAAARRESVARHRDSRLGDQLLDKRRPPQPPARPPGCSPLRRASSCTGTGGASSQAQAAPSQRPSPPRGKSLVRTAFMISDSVNPLNRGFFDTTPRMVSHLMELIAQLESDPDSVVPGTFQASCWRPAAAVAGVIGGRPGRRTSGHVSVHMFMHGLCTFSPFVRAGGDVKNATAGVNAVVGQPQLSPGDACCLIAD